MSIATLILGASGTGKSTSLRNMDPQSTFLIQCIKKPLPFKAQGWTRRNSLADPGNVYSTTDTREILNLMRKSPHAVFVIDDYQAVMVNELMNRSAEKSYEKFTDIGKHAWEVFNTAGSLADNRRVYILAHTTTDESGETRMKTVGKMVDQTIVPEGYFTIVLKTEVVNNVYRFRTQTTGHDPCKSPIGMFPTIDIDNDLAAVDKAITDFYEITNEAKA